MHQLEDCTVQKAAEKLLQEVPAVNCYGEPITVVAAIKTQSEEAVLSAVSGGILHLGENRVQEFNQRYSFFREQIPAVRLHFFGRLQQNKVKCLVGNVDLIHSVDRIPLAEKISQLSVQRQTVTDVLLEVNVSGEETKAGFAPEELSAAIDEVLKLPNLRVRGLMTMLPHAIDDDKKRLLAQKMRGLYDALKNRLPDCTYLSMGMSGDWRICIENGSNLVRIGTGIFGERR